MRNQVHTLPCPYCAAPTPVTAERCGECQQLLVVPPPLPLLRRPGASWALAAIMMGMLGTITGGLLALLALPALVMAWRDSQQRAARRLCPGVRLLMGVGVLAAILGIGVGIWSLSTVSRSPLASPTSASIR